jgi:tetrahydromethanopterin S-methyltransferase subunit A
LILNVISHKKCFQYYRCWSAFRKFILNYPLKIAKSQKSALGSVTAENFGIEKVIVNVLAKQKINCLIVCGEENDHLAGQSMISLAENGVSTMAGARKIIGSDSPLPYLNEIPMTAISRFLREIKVIDLVGNKDTAAIQKAIDSCTAPSRSEAHIAIMPEIDENTWKKYEKLVTQNVMSKIKKG